VGGPSFAEVHVRVAVNHGAGFVFVTHTPTALNSWQFMLPETTLLAPTLVRVERAYRSKGQAEPGWYHVPVAVEFRADEPPYPVS
jgi:hypothetical protein